MHNALRALVPAVLLATGLAISSAEAAPAATGLAPLKSAPEASSLVEKTYWTVRCYRNHYGVRHCHRVWVKPYRHHRHYRHHHRHRHH